MFKKMKNYNAKRNNYLASCFMACLLIILFLNFSLVNVLADEPTLEYYQFVTRVATALYETYVTYQSDGYEEYNEMTHDSRVELLNGNLAGAIAIMEDLIESYLEPLQDKFFIYVTSDGLQLLQTPSALNLLQGERGYLPLLICNETPLQLTLSITSEVAPSRYISAQTITVNPGSKAYASSVITLVDVVYLDSGEYIVPLQINVIDTSVVLSTSFSLNVSRATPNIFSYLPDYTSNESDFTTSAVILDVDGDMDLDIYCGNYGYPNPAQNTIYYNQGNKIFNPQVLDDPEPRGTRDVAPADMDGNGITDHIIDGNINVGVSDAEDMIRSLNLSDPIPLNSEVLDTVRVIVEDINLNDDDPRPQLLVCNVDEGVQLFMNNGAGGFETTPVWSSSEVYSAMGLGDVDADGIKDLAVSPGGYVAIYKGKLNGQSGISFEEKEEAALWQPGEKVDNPMQLFFNDFDGDGDQDFIVVAKKAYLYKNYRVESHSTDLLTVDPQWVLDLPYQIPSCAAIGDINNDRLNDIVIGFYTAFDVHKRLLGGENKIYLGITDDTGEKTFSAIPAWTSFYSDKTTDVALDDFDSDGLLDLYVANDGENYIYFNLGFHPSSLNLPPEPSLFYKGNIHSQIGNIPAHEPSLTFAPPNDASQTIGFNMDIYRASESEELQNIYEDLNAKVAGFWIGNNCPFEGMYYFNLADNEISAVKDAGASTIMVFNPGYSNRWEYASNNKKSIDNLDTYAWMAKNFSQRYGPTGLLAQVKGFSPDDKVLYGTTNEPEHERWPTKEIGVKKQNCLFDVVKEFYPEILVTTANHGGAATAIGAYNQAAEALGLGGYYKFDIVRIQTYYDGLCQLNLAENDENFFYDEFYTPNFPNGEGLTIVQDTRNLLFDPQYAWANYNYEVVSGEGNANGNLTTTANYYPTNPPPGSGSDIPFMSEAQLAIEVVGGALRNISNLLPHFATNPAFNFEAPKVGVETLIDMLQNYQYAGIQGQPEILNDNKVIVYKFQNNDDGSNLYAVRASPGYAQSPHQFTPQTITLTLSNPTSSATSTNIFDGQAFTGNDVLAINPNFLDAPSVTERWVTIPNVTHGQYTEIIDNINNGQVVVTLPNNDFYYIKEIINTNIAPVFNSIPSPQQVEEGQTLVIQLNATDPGDTLTFSYSPTITNAQLDQLNNNAAEFIFNPDYTQAGSYDLTFTVTDGNLSTSQPINIEVVNINRAPYFDSLITSPQNVNVGENISIQFSAIDPDNEILTYSVVSLPEGATLNSQTALFFWTPNTNQGGLTYTITFKVQDQEGLFDQENVTIDVLEAEQESQAGLLISPDDETTTQSGNSGSGEVTPSTIFIGAYIPTSTSNDEVKQENNEALPYSKPSQENIADQQSSSNDELLLSDMLSTENSQENNFASSGYYQPVKQAAILANNPLAKLGAALPLPIPYQDETLTQETVVAVSEEVQPAETSKKAPEAVVLTTSAISLLMLGLSVKAIIKLIIAMKLF